MPVCALVTTGFLNTTLNETLSGTVPVGAKLLTPGGIDVRDAPYAHETAIIRIRIAMKSF